MLNSLASYLLGYPGSSGAAAGSDTEASITVHVPSPAPSDQDVRLRAVEADDDWLLVDKADEDGLSEAAPASTPAVSVPAAARLTLAVSTTSYHWPDSEDAASAGPAGLGAAPGALEESWFVTPPPCFTSGSVPLETSPLENLLIEHPSMSVYHRSAGPQAAATPLSSSVGAATPARSSLRKLNRAATAAAAKKAVPTESSAPPRTATPSTAASASVSSEGEATTLASASPSSPTRSSSPSPSPTTAVQASPRRHNAFSPYQQQQQAFQYRTAQKLVQRAACQQLKRDSLERNNKAREIRSSRNKRQRRSDHMNHHSGANNNRKC